MKKRWISALLALCLTVMCLTAGAVTVTAEEADLNEISACDDLALSGADYGLPDQCKDGNILQCFNWTLSQIKEELPNIAEAGFTSVQTSPLQAHDGGSTWYWLYQPKGFSVGNELGSYNDLKTLCTEAHKYGVKIIVDVVANHLAGSNSGSWAGSIDNDMKNSAYFHNQGPCNDYDNRYDLTHKNIGMPDLNSEHTYVQGKVSALVQNLKSAGVDGIRWDAAKHISLPSENCSFWANVIDPDMYNYGEVLEGPAGKTVAASVNNALIQEYAGYLGVTDDSYSAMIISACKNKESDKSTGYWTTRGVSADRLVYWGESHDTYSNTDGWTKNIDQSTIDKVYAILGARADAQTLYLSRPFEKNYGSIYAGKKGSTHFTSKEIAAVNHFHNAMVGTAENYYTTKGNYVISRERGAVIVSTTKSDVDITVKNSNSMVPSGIYTDEVSGTSWTVTETTIKGHLGSCGIAVIYGDPEPLPTEAPTSPATEKPTEEPTSAPTEKPTTAPTEVTGCLLGDTDGDGVVSVIDATLIQKKMAKISVQTFIEAAADADQDGVISVIDATQIQKFKAQLPANPNIGKPI
ncbi:MAG: hypothetical protein IJH32_09855 [Ruminococcus sp.]|nr:hypothetical protein [Ruminococcus sp.]